MSTTIELVTGLDGKYAALGEIPRRVLRRLSVFAGEFTLEAARAVVVSTGLHRSVVSAAIATLHAQALLEADPCARARERYLLSHPTRAFALGKLVRHGEQDIVARNHALYLQCVLEYAEIEFDRGEPGPWMERYAWLLEDVRAALEWAFSPSGDPFIGVDLTMAAIPLWLLSSQSDELQRRIGCALKSGAAVGHSGRQMRLRTAARLACVSDF